MSQPPLPEPSDAEATIMIPRPGGRRSPPPPASEPSQDETVFVRPSSAGTPAAPAFPAAPAAPSVPTLVPSAALSGTNPLLAHATALLNAVPTIRRTLSHHNPHGLREQLLSDLREFENAARQDHLKPDHVLIARYALCTVLDEAVAQMPWGESSGWGRQSLLVSLHKETWGGEKFFQLLDKALEDPRGNVDLLEVLYVCLALGFEGRFRVLDNGRAQLDALRGRLHDVIRRERGEFDKDLSGSWRGLQRQPKPLVRRIPPWIVLAGFALVLFGVYVTFALLLARASDPVFASLGNIRAEPGQVTRTLAAPTPQAPVVPRLRPLLRAEIELGLLDVIEEAHTSHVVLKGDSFYPAGKADIRSQLVPVLARVAEAMNQVPGTVTVVGHTDNQPIRSLRFPSNYELSLQRAQGVAALLAERLQDRGRIRAEGVAESQPLASNDTPEGRARNRRVEITLRSAL